MESKRDGHHCGSSMVCSMSSDLRISSSHCGRWEKDRNLCSKQARGVLPKRFLPLPGNSSMSRSYLDPSVSVTGKQQARRPTGSKRERECVGRWELGPKTEQWQPSKEYSYFHITLILLNMRSECKITQYSTI